jgi:hypothetical protein
MLPGLTLPASLLEMLAVLRPCFTAPGFATFCGLVAGLAGRVGRRTVVGMLLGGCLQHLWPHDPAHYFFATTPPTSMTAAPPSPGTGPRPSPPSRTCSSSCAGR